MKVALKGSVVVTIKPSETIGTLSHLLRDKRIGAAIVSSDGQTVDAGTFGVTEHQFAGWVASSNFGAVAGDI